MLNFFLNFFQLKGLDLPDADDPIFVNYDSEFDISQRLDTLASYSEIYQRRIEEGIPKADLEDKREVRRIMVKKKYFGYVKSPNLLTWMEKQMIIKLNKEDPTTWDYDMLSEHFPATPNGIKNIIKRHKIRKPYEISTHDEKVKENWKLLKEGNLPNSNEIVEHMNKFGQKTLPMKKELEQSVLEEYHASRQPIKPDLSGEFGSILVQHKKRIGDYKENAPNEVVLPNILNSDLDFLDSLNEPDPYGGTSKINAEDNTKFTRKNITVDKFRKLFYNEMKLKAKKNEPYAKEYFKWLKTETSLLEQANAQKPDLIGDTETLETVEEQKVIKKYAESKVVKLEKFNNNITEIVEKIDIPKHLYKENATYQVGNCFYDSKGDFIHRIPMNDFPEQYI